MPFHPPFAVVVIGAARLFVSFVRLLRGNAFHRRAVTAVSAMGLLLGGVTLGIGPALLESQPANASSTPCGNGAFSSSPLMCTYQAVGSDTFTVPDNVTAVTLDAFGGQGGPGISALGGALGGEAKATFAVKPGDVFQIDTAGAGGGGVGGGGSGGPAASAGAGGGGGAAGDSSGGPGGDAGGFTGGGGGGGGGASDIRAGACAATLSCGLSARVIVAGGGGGASDGDNGSATGGGGGGIPGGDGSDGAGGHGLFGGGHGSGGSGGTSSAGGSSGGGGVGQGGGGNGAAGTGGSLGSGGSGGNGGSGFAGGSDGAGGGGGGGGYFGGGAAGGGGGGGLISAGGSGGGGGGGSGFIVSTAANPAFNTGVRQGNGQVSVTWKVNPSIATTASSSVAVGQSISDSATLTGGFSPSGTITFSLYGPGDTNCTTPLETSGTGASGNGPYTSTAYSTAAVGTYKWVTSYGGDINNNPAGPTGCADPNETVSVTQATPTLGTQASSGTATVGSTISDSALLGGGFNPGGSVSFALFANNSCNGSPVTSGAVQVNGDGTYGSGPISAPAQPGTYYWVATYGGDINNNSVSSPCDAEPVIVQEAQAITFTSTPPGSPAVGGTYTVSATGGASGNPVTFTIDASSTSGCSISGSTVTFNHPGSCVIDANQTGNADYSAAPQAQQTITVSRATPNLTWAAPASITYGTPLTSTQLDATASVPGTFSYNPPAGTVLQPGTQTLTATFTPADTTDYTGGTVSTQIKVIAAPVVASVRPSSGPLAGGTTVTVTGSGFTGATAVDFGSVAASSFTVNSDTSITATAPAAVSVRTVDVTVTTPAGTSAASAADRYSYIYAFTGFLAPVANPPTFNVVHAGQAIPIQFQLGGDFGLGILAAGYPTAQQVSCTTGAPDNTTTETDTAGGNGLQYDATTNTYTYVWKTSKASKGTCQAFILGLTDGTVHTALFEYVN